MIFFRCDAAKNIGLGHLRRCQAIAELMHEPTKIGFMVDEISRTEAHQIKASGYTFIETGQTGSSLSDEISLLPPQCRGVIVDLGHSTYVNHPQELISYVAALKIAGLKVAMIDGMGDDAVFGPDFAQIDILVQPYWGVSETTSPQVDHWLRGENLVILPAEYEHQFRPRNPDQLNNILVTFGGSDPQHNSYKVLTALCAFGALIEDEKINIKLVAGPNFDEANLAQCETLGAAYANVTLEHAPEGLAHLFDWADICICGSGQSRYEAFACGVPVIFTSIYRRHDKLSEAFAAFGTSIYLGNCENMSANDMRNAINKLRTDTVFATQMLSEIAQRQPDTFSTRNLAQKLSALLI